MENKPSFSTSEVAHYCHVTADTIRKWAEAGRIQVFKTPGGHRRIRREELIRFLQENNIPVHSDLSASSVKILLADEEKAALGVIRRFLERAPKSFQIETAEDAFETGYHIAAMKPNVVIIASRLSGLDGLEICRKIKASPGLGNMHVILITDGSGNHQHDRLHDLGIAGVLKKPFLPDEMRRTLARVGVEVN